MRGTVPPCLLLLLALLLLLLSLGVFLMKMGDVEEWFEVRLERVRVGSGAVEERWRTLIRKAVDGDKTIEMGRGVCTQAVLNRGGTGRGEREEWG